jgi:type IV pilus assembly protein PilO
MAIQDIIDSVKNFDPEQLNDFNNVGSWPMPIKVLLWVAAFGGAIAAGYFLHVTKLQTELATTQKKEVALREDYQTKAEKAAHLDAYRKQKADMEESFGALLRQLPSDTEIPGLIEDITLVGLRNNLNFTSIDLQPEVVREYYVEKPIQIVVSGGYHDLGAFVSDVADLPRIVTLHDFTISPIKGSKGAKGAAEAPGSGLLNMTITAKTYRYKDTRK